MNDNQKPVISKEYSVEEFDGEILLYSEAGGQAVYLNDTAYIVWLLCHENLTIGQMIISLEEAYPEEKEQIRADVLLALEMLMKSGIIHFTNE